MRNEVIKKVVGKTVIEIDKRGYEMLSELPKSIQISRILPSGHGKLKNGIKSIHIPPIPKNNIKFIVVKYLKRIFFKNKEINENNEHI